MKIISKGSGKKLPFNLDAELIYNAKTFDIVYLSFKPNEVLAPHSNDVDVIFVVLSGNGIFIYENEMHEVKQYDIISVEKYKLRGWSNTNNSLLNLLVLRSSS